MAGRRSRRSGTASHGAVPDPSLPRLRRPVGRALLVLAFGLISLLGAFWLVAFFGTLIFDPSDIDGLSDVVLFLVVQVILTGIWLPLYRGVRGARIPSGPPGRSARRLVARAVRPRPAGRHTLASNPIGPRTALSAQQINYASWLSGVARLDREGLGLSEDGGGPLARLASAEQALGNALYELDRHHALSRERISALRVAGLEASAWLVTNADLAAFRPRGMRRVAEQIQDGVRRYTDLARATENFLVGRVGIAQLEAARAALVCATSESLVDADDATG